LSKASKGEKKKDSSLAENRKARFNYAIEETFEAGIVLRGTEVKSCRAGKINLTDGYCAFRGDELFLQSVHISEYTHGNQFNHDPRAVRKLLLKRKDLNRLLGLWNGGHALVPLKMYVKKSHIKVLIGLGKGKKTHDKRETLKRKQADREIAREFRKGG